MSRDKAAAALSFIPSHDRDTWVRMAMAVKAEFSEDGFDLWDTWSQGADSYDERAAKAVWRSIGAAGRVGIGTLYHEAKAHGWRDDTAPRGPLTLAELRAQRETRATRAAATAAEDARKQRGYAAAAARAEVVIARCTPKVSNYLSGKGLPEVLGLDDAGVLVVPMRNVETNQLQGIQTITWLPDTRQWEKKMAPGMRAKGAVLRLGSKQVKEAFLCEGYATGLSLDLALRRLRLSACVVVCFSAHNLTHVAPLIGGRKFVFADHDASGTGQAAAKSTGLAYCTSPVLGEDANDLHVRAGLLALCELVLKVRACPAGQQAFGGVAGG
ncbi:hypothetical protein GJ698_02855 [Pseudoduganella sp. FT26W]|uniref:Toprim domain-containing protein n=1 Tax=Duganella aquatilis TaxID=2666082 RepID=A0A844D730_9BURK|nr:PriCT-2 domain-containing protein [Duganella aquatilis]MRW83029.1 hypothetical protein [Duganella aquatilis]